MNDLSYFFSRVIFMSERIARLHAHQRNIERYEGLLKSNLNETELRFVNRRLLARAEGSGNGTNPMSPGDPSRTIQLPLPDALLQPR